MVRGAAGVFVCARFCLRVCTRVLCFTVCALCVYYVMHTNSCARESSRHKAFPLAQSERSVKRSDQGTRLWLQSTFDPHIACTFCGALNFINTQEGKTRVAFTEIEAGRQRATAAE